MLFFTVEVRVQAQALISVPPNCLEKNETGVCTLTTKNLFNFSESGVQLRVEPTSVVQKKSAQNWVLMLGKVFLDSEKETLIESLYGEVKVEQGKAIFISDRKQLKIYSLSGQVLYRPKGNDSFHNLPAGFMQKLSRVDSTGQSGSLIPQPILIDEVIPVWSTFYKAAELPSFRADLMDFRTTWSEATELAGPWYLATIERQVASLEKERELERLRKKKAQKEQLYFREMFKRRNFMD